MAWLSNFLLGYPGSEYSFEINPEAMSIDEIPIAVLHRTLNGDLKKSVLKTSAPIIRINSSYLSLAQRNQFASLAGVDNTFLSFQVRDDLAVIAERDLSTDTTHVTIRNTSATRLSTYLVQNGYAGDITITSVADGPNIGSSSGYGLGGYGSGFYSPTEYYTAGSSYNDLTRVITLASPLPSAQMYVYVSYTYKGWLVNMDKLSHSIQGGWVDRFQYDFQLTGA